jgi:hypothetical protein
MERPVAIDHIKEACKSLALDLMKIHPAVPPLADEATQKEIYEAIYRITKDVELIKKKVIKLQNSEDQPDL